MMAATTMATGNITKENVETVAKLVKKDLKTPEADAFFNLCDVTVPYNEAVRKWLYNKKLSLSFLDDISMEDYLQAYGLYLLDNIQTEWDSSTYRFVDYVVITTRPHGKFHYSLMKDYCDCSTAATPLPTDDPTQKKRKYVRSKIYMSSIDDCVNVPDNVNTIRNADLRMNIAKLLDDLGLNDVNRDILIACAEDNYSMQKCNHGRSVPYQYIREVILSKHGIALTDAQIYAKITWIRQKIAAKNPDIQEYM